MGCDVAVGGVVVVLVSVTVEVVVVPAVVVLDVAAVVVFTFVGALFVSSAACEGVEGIGETVGLISSAFFSQVPWVLFSDRLTKPFFFIRWLYSLQIREHMK